MKRHLIDIYSGSSTPNNFADNFGPPSGYNHYSSYTLIPKSKSQKPKYQKAEKSQPKSSSSSSKLLWHYKGSDDDDDYDYDDIKLAKANSLREIILLKLSIIKMNYGQGI